MKFTIECADKQSRARAGMLETQHGSIPTPVFMPVGTAGTVKGVHFSDLENLVGAGIILGNTYHLYLRPGTEIIEPAGGLHRFTGWKKAMLTDSGGYQVYSLAATRKITEEGAAFQSHIDGSRHLFTPEKVMDIQRAIGADIIMAFDECPPFESSRDYMVKSMDLTHRWLDRCIDRFSGTTAIHGYDQALFPIVQGGVHADLRRRSAEYIAAKDAEGNAIGGLSVGEPEQVMYEIAGQVCDILPASKPRYLMGVGTPANILHCIGLGVDMFDCVLPTRNGRNAMIFTREGILNLRNEKWKRDFSCLDDSGITRTGLGCSRAYLRHLFISGEMLGPMLASLHNLEFYLWLVRTAREKILEGRFIEWKEGIIEKLSRRL